MRNRLLWFVLIATLGCLAFRQVEKTAPMYGVFHMEGSEYPCTDAGLKSVIAFAESYGGGIVDARFCSTLTLTSQTNVGDGSASITLLVPNTGTWTASTVVDGSSCFLNIENGSAILGAGMSNGGNSFRIQAVGSVNAGAMICTNAPYTRVDGGILLYSPSGATFANGLFYSLNAADGTIVRAVTTGNYSGIGFKIEAPCCGVKFDDDVANGNGGAGAQPVVIVQGNGDQAAGPVSFFNLSADHAGAGQSEVSVTQTGGNVFQYNFFNLYMEGNTSAQNSPFLDVSISNGSVNVFGGHVYCRSASETGFGIQVENNTGQVNVQSFGYWNTNTTRNVLHDLKNAVSVTAAANETTLISYNTVTHVAVGPN